MNVLVTGGAGSGKSAYAEAIACRLSPQRTYLATMASQGHEAQARIARHRAQRAGQGFETIECADGLAAAQHRSAQRSGVALLDDLGNLVANALFAPDGTQSDADEVLARLSHEVLSLPRHYEHVVVVGNEVGSDGCTYDEATQTWIRLSGSLACHIAAAFDTVVEVAAGMPTVIKGVVV